MPIFLVGDMSLKPPADWTELAARALLTALRERDPYTYGHSRRVARTARLLARAAGLDIEAQRIIEFSSLFHDLGKLGIPDSVLLKPGRLSPEEREMMKMHPVKSVEIIKPLLSIPFFSKTVPGIRHHHERIDGLGYPDRIKADEIPLEARIILIADTFDAMTTTRPYRMGLTQEVALKELKTFAGRQFDPKLVDIFIKAASSFGDYEEEITESFITTHYKRTKKAA